MPPKPLIDLQQLTRRVSAFQAPAAQPPAAPAEPAPTYAMRITRDIPARIEAARARLSAGDTRGGKAILDGVNAWIDEHADSLQEFSNYRGSDRFGRSVSKSALDLLERKSITELLPMTDPSANPRSVEFDAASRGWGPKTAELTRKARYENDPEAIALLSTATRPVAVAPGQTGKASAPTGPDEAFLSYYGTAKSRLVGGLSPDVASQFSADELVDMLGKSYKASDRTAGTALIGNVVAAVNEARDLEPAAKANLARTMFTAQGAAMDSWGGEDDAKWRADGASVLSALRRALPGEAFTAQKDTVARVMKATAETAKLWAADGRPMSADKMAQFARIRLYNETRPAEPMRPEDQAAAAVITETSALQQRLTVSPVMSVPQGGKEGPRPEDLQAGYTYLQGLLRAAVGSAGADAFTAGRTLQETLPARKNEIALGLRQFSPTLTESEAANVAGLMVPMLLSGKEIDLRKLSDLTGKDPVVAATEQADRIKGLENGTPEIVESVLQRVDKTLGDKTSAASDADRSINMAVREANTTAPIPFTSGRRLFREVNKAMATAAASAQDYAFTEIAKLPVSELLATSQSPKEAQARAGANLLGRLIDVPGQDRWTGRLDLSANPAAGKLIEAYKAGLRTKGVPALYSALDPQAVEEAAQDFASRSLKALRGLAAGLGVNADTAAGMGNQTVADLIGSAADLAAKYRSPPATSLGGLGVWDDPVRAESSRLSAAFLRKGQAPRAEALSSLDAKSKALGQRLGQEGNLNSVAELRTKVSTAVLAFQPPAATEAPETGRVDPLLLAGVDVAVARSGLDKIKARADKPVSDAATADLLTRSIPNTLEMMVRRGELSPVDARRFEAAAHEMGESGVGFKAIAESFNLNVEKTSTAYLAKRAEADKQKYLERLAARNASALGGLADPGETE